MYSITKNDGVTRFPVAPCPAPPEPELYRTGYSTLLVNPDCPAGYKWLKNEAGGFMGLGHRSVCRKMSRWETLGDGDQAALKEECCAGKHATPRFKMMGYTFGGRLDTSVCKKEWCPWSKECEKASATRAYCSGATDGRPNLVADANCSAWCDANEAECDAIKVAYCNRPDKAKDPVCGCLAPQSDKDFRDFIDQTTRVVNTNLGPTPCWWPKCAGSSTNVFKTREIRAAERSCPATKVDVCAQVIAVDKNSSGNVFNNNTFKQVCGRDLPPKDKPKPGGGGPAPAPAPKPPTCGRGQELIGDECEDKEEQDQSAFDRFVDEAKETASGAKDFFNELSEERQSQAKIALAAFLLLVLVFTLKRRFRG